MRVHRDRQELVRIVHLHEHHEMRVFAVSNASRCSVTVQRYKRGDSGQMRPEGEPLLVHLAQIEPFVAAIQEAAARLRLA